MRTLETFYNGYRFRSRLEARWAVFFDALGILYEYEKEGFDLDEAGWYLPDFWLPRFDSWLEIKPEKPPLEAGAKAGALSKYTGKLVFIFDNCLPPSIECKVVDEVPDATIRNYGIYYAPDGDSDGMMAFGICPGCQEITIGYLGGHWIFCKEEFEIYKGTCDGGLYDYLEDPRLMTAYVAARQARFEHGEKR